MEPYGRGLLVVARERMRVRRLALRTEQAYLDWIRRYIAFHGRRHPRELGAPDAEAFLTCLAVQRKVAAATQDQALQALLFFIAMSTGSTCHGWKMLPGLADRSVSRSC